MTILAESTAPIISNVRNAIIDINLISYTIYYLRLRYLDKSLWVKRGPGIYARILSWGEVSSRTLL